MLVRRLECLEGSISFTLTCAPAADFGKRFLAGRRRGRGSATFNHRDGLIHLATDGDFELGPAGVRSRFSLAAGDVRTFVLSFNENGPAVFPPLQRIADLCEATQRYWKSWAARISYDGPYREHVVRSALALKLLAFAPSGAIIAAPTTSLPERIGASFNWDYRFCWLRDAAFTVEAFFGLGLEAEARAFLHWLLHATRLTLPQLQVVYGVFGRPALPEKTLDHLSGYEGSRPVRAGNEAYKQKQLDVYGDVINAAAICRREGISLTGDERSFLKSLAAFVLGHWREADAGIWETREGERQHVYAKVMCWVALDRAARLADAGELDLNAARLRDACEEIRRVVEAEGFDQRLQSYTSTLGGEQLDAALLTLPLTGYASPGDPRMRSTIEAIRGSLARGELVYRHRRAETEDEGAFLLCTSWLVQCLALQGGLAEARSLFEALLARANDVGLFSEEIDAQSGRFLGNFPQAFTHVGLINAALRLQEAETGRKEG
jgi:GH15 family glucan-1,4-alpha-glucosidase